MVVPSPALVNAGERRREYLGVVEGQLRQRVEPVPRRLGRVVTGRQRRQFVAESARERDTHRPSTRIASRIAERPDLHEVSAEGEPRLLEKLATGGILQTLTLVDEATGKRPGPCERL
jgi:hypothetical protein